MSDNAKTAAAHQPQPLVATLLEALGAAIATARAKEAAGASAAMAVLLEQWRSQLVAASPAAVSPAQLVTALTSIFLLCDVRVVDTGPHPGVHIDGPAAAAFDAALRLVYVCDRMCGSTVGEEAMVALLGGFMTVVPNAAQGGDRLH